LENLVSWNKLFSLSGNGLIFSTNY